METSIKIENGMESATNTNPQETSTTEAKNRDEGEGGWGQHCKLYHTGGGKREPGQSRRDWK